MVRVWENGFIGYLRQKSFPPIPRQCQPWGGNRVGDTPFKLNDLVGVFVIFMGGCLLALTIFITEWILFLCIGWQIFSTYAKFYNLI